MNDREKWRESVRDIRASGTMMMMMMIPLKKGLWWVRHETASNVEAPVLEN